MSAKEAIEQSISRVDSYILKCRELGHEKAGIIDILTDIRHYCSAKGINIGEALQDSWEYYNEETIERNLENDND